MNFRVQYWIPSLILLASFCLHLSLISKGPVSVDCLNLAINSQATINTYQLHYQFGSGYPLMVILGTIFISIGKLFNFTDPILMVNFISVVFGSVAILAFYLLIQRICNQTTAIFASILLLLNPLFFDISIYGINHAPSICFLLLAILSLLRFQNTKNIAHLLLSALYLGFMGSTRLQDFILILPTIIYLFIKELNPSSTHNNTSKTNHFFLFITLILLIIILFHLPYFIFNHTNYSVQAQEFIKIGLTENFKSLYLPSLLNCLTYTIKSFTFIGIICFGIGIYLIFKDNKKLLILIVLWLLIPLSFYGNLTTTAPRFLNIILPAFIIPISIFLAQMFNNGKKAWKIIASITLLIIALQPLSETQGTFIRRHTIDSISDYYRWVGKITEPDATIISSDDAPFITYYSNRRLLSKPASTTHLSPNEMNDFKIKIDNSLNKHKSVYITLWSLYSYDRYWEFDHLIYQNYQLIRIGQRPLELWYSTPFMPAPPMCALFRIENKN